MNHKLSLSVIFCNVTLIEQDKNVLIGNCFEVERVKSSITDKFHTYRRR